MFGCADYEPYFHSRNVESISGRTLQGWKTLGITWLYSGCQLGRTESKGNPCLPAAGYQWNQVNSQSSHLKNSLSSVWCSKMLATLTEKFRSPAPPSVRSVLLKEVSPGTFCGDGKYHGGLEGKSEKSWYRENPDGCKLLIEGASSRIYVATHNDYMCRIIFWYTASCNVFLM